MYGDCLRGNEGEKTVIRIYCMKNIFNKKFKGYRNKKRECSGYFSNKLHIVEDVIFPLFFSFDGADIIYLSM